MVREQVLYRSVDGVVLEPPSRRGGLDRWKGVVDERIWAQRAQPARGPGETVLGHWEPLTPGELTLFRRELSAAVHAGGRRPAPTEDAVERLLLVFEEIASNALRHGLRPVRVEVTDTGETWLLVVSDAAPGAPPAPPTDRDPALGGLGLRLVAHICAAHGWSVEAGRKHVWAEVHHVLADEPAERRSVPSEAPTGLGASPGFPDT